MQAIKVKKTSTQPFIGLLAVILWNLLLGKHLLNLSIQNVSI